MKNLIIILAIVSLTWGLKSNTWHSVVRQDEKFVVVEGKQVQGSLAWGIYVDDNYNDGWGKITLHTNAFKHQDEAYAAGFLEGSMQTKYISFVHHIHNINSIKLTSMIRSSRDLRHLIHMSQISLRNNIITLCRKLGRMQDHQHTG